MTESQYKFINLYHKYFLILRNDSRKKESCNIKLAICIFHKITDTETCSRGRHETFDVTQSVFVTTVVTMIHLIQQDGEKGKEKKTSCL